MTPSVMVPFQDGAQVVFNFSLGGKPLSNRIWLLNRQPPTDITQIIALANAAASFWTSNMLPLQGSDLSFDTVTASSWDNPGLGVSATVAGGGFGGASSQSHSANVAIRVSFEGTNDHAVKMNGHFFAGVPLDAVSVNTIDPAYADALFEAYVAMIDAVFAWGVTPAWRWVVASQSSSGAIRSEMLIRRCDFIHVRVPYVTQRRKRLK